jgi:hypothetical protein
LSERGTNLGVRSSTMLAIWHVVRSPSEMFLLAFILFLPTVAFSATLASKLLFVTDHIVSGMRVIIVRLRFHFYWIFIFFALLTSPICSD